MSGLGSVRKCDFDTDFEFCDVISSVSDRQVAPSAPKLTTAEAADVARSNIKLSVSEESDLSSTNSETTSKRHRRTGVYEISSDSEKNPHGRYLVKQNAIREEQSELDDKLFKQIENLKIEKGNASSENGGENLLVPPVSGYCSSTASAGSEDESDKMVCRLVRRCESSDSAIVHSDEETVTVRSNWGETREEIDELPYAYPVFSPYSPRRSIDHENVPTKTLIEAQCVPFPLDRKQSDSFSETSDILTNDSRRQSCFTDDSEEISRYRYWRTPSVVVSDYSDDPVGLSLEDIEYIRNQQKDNSSSPESSLHSSCSNLFGSNPDTFRKVSDCSTCSFSGDDDSEYSREGILYTLRLLISRINLDIKEEPVLSPHISTGIVIALLQQGCYVGVSDKILRIATYPYSL
ncbi:hypothetical protein WA026_009811 [Henosepilachna vigintioctopunctata]|uniref:Uncharacterized protein n=1 Tax=Henosepilachna vigintioctopunctata TaxID=420089 RepID=A0AAW1TR92_9CUCU